MIQLHEAVSTGKKAAKKGLGALVKIMTNDLVHVFTGLFTKVITEEFTDQMSAPITAAVSNAVRDESVNWLTGRVGDSLKATLPRILFFTIPTALNNLLPSQLLKSLTNTVTNTLVRALTHTVTPTLVNTLGASPEQHAACWSCTHHGTDCGQCSQTPQHLYYASYYSDFSASYYSDYYAGFYTSKPKQKDVPKARARAKLEGGI